MPSFSPVAGSVGDTVTITGNNFGDTIGKVTFNNVPAPPTHWEPTRIETVVPRGATNGEIVVEIPEKSNAGAKITIKFVCPFKVQ